MYADMTDSQKCMRRFLHDCLDEFDGASQDAYVQLSQGLGAFKALGKVTNRWQQLRAYLVRSGLTYGQKHNNTNTFEAEICISIDNDLDAIHGLKRPDKRAEALLGVVAKIHLVLTFYHKKQL
jgi:hypothetical protein